MSCSRLLTMFACRSLRIVLTLVVSGLLVISAQAPENVKAEYQVKARMLKLFANYTTWPPGAAANDSGKPFVLGVIGESPFENFLETQFRAEPIKSKAVQIRFVSDPEDLSDLDMVFVCGSKASQLPLILRRLKGKRILTVGDTPGFAQYGVMVNFFYDGNRTKFEVNLDSVQAEQLAISSHVLKLAKIVR